MRRFVRYVLLLALGVLIAGNAFGSTGKWPDGSRIDRWFAKSSKQLKGRQARSFVITSYGAVSDSTIVQTAAIQKAIDAAAVSGGTVVIPRGVWLSGALFFKPRTHLLLEDGAVL